MFRILLGLAAASLLIGCSFLTRKVDAGDIEGCYLHAGRPALHIRGSQIYDARGNAPIATFEFRDLPAGTFLYIRPVVYFDAKGSGFRSAPGAVWRLVSIRSAGSSIQILFPTGIMTTTTLEKAEHRQCHSAVG